MSVEELKAQHDKLLAKLEEERWQHEQADNEKLKVGAQVKLSLLRGHGSFAL
jgi:hypothetical protein